MPHRPFSPSTVVAVGNQTASTDVLDMPVDPNEPTYCLCHQVSFGEMVGCDNSDVSRPCPYLVDNMHKLRVGG